VILADTGIFIAATDRDDRHHLECAALVVERADEFIIPHTVVVEVCWMLERTFGPSVEAEFLRSVVAGTPKVEALGMEDYLRTAELVDSYADLRLGMVDASIVAVAERLDISTIATLNRRDFTVVRPRHAELFQLVP
jgi:predicted nucleic acid-binding protein